MMKSFLFLAFLLLPFTALAQTETCPRVWRSGDSLLTDPAPHIQWLREDQPIPGANQRWLLPPPNERARYSVVVRGGLSSAFPYDAGAGYELAGYVFDELHRPVAGATVRRGPFAAATDEKGRFILTAFDAKPAEGTPFVVTVEKAGYWRNASRQYISSFYTTETRMMLHSQRVTNRMDATQGGEMAYRGFTLHLPPNAVQTENGTPYNGTILLSVEGATPRDPDFGLRMPGGDFAAIDEGGNDVMLYSYGYLSAEMKTESGEKLELRPEARATLRFHLPYTETHSPDSVPLWHFNTETAVWEQEGWSMRNGSIYEGEVSHFSSWNCDVPAERSTVRGRVIDCNELPVKGGWVRVGQRHAVTDSVGNYWSFVPGDLAFDVWTQSDTLRDINVPAQQERTLADLTGSVFSGLAVWNPQTQTLNVYLSGNAPDSLRLSIDNGQSWTADREFTGVAQAPEAIMLEDACADGLRIFTLPKAEDCQILDSLELANATWHTGWEEAFASEETVNCLVVPGGTFDDRWDLLFSFSCLQELYIAYEDRLTSLSEGIGNLTSLQSLVLHYNSLTSLPESIGNLIALQNLNLEQNDLTNLPESIGNLKALRTLDLNYNAINSLPQSIGNLTALQLLDLSTGRRTLTSLPESIGNLIALETLRLRYNILTALPESIGNLTLLKELDLYDNEIQSLPESIGNLTALLELNLSGNSLTYLPESIGNLTALLTLDLSGNSLTYLPESIWNQTALLTLDLSGNSLGFLSENIGNLTVMNSLDIGNTALISLPESIGNLTTMKYLYLTSNSLTELPESLGNLTGLQRLNVNLNALTSLPESIGNLSALQMLHVDDNLLSSLPESVGNLSALQVLYLDNNRLTSLPESIGNLSALQALHVENNLLTELPENIVNLTALRRLYLSGNPIPEGSRAIIQDMLPNTQITW